jgi:hypothetical protein
MLNARDEPRCTRLISASLWPANTACRPRHYNAGDQHRGLAKRIADLPGAHARKLRVEDIEGGTFTVNNTGSFGSIASKPILNYPQVGIVTMERAVKRPVVREDDSIAVRWIMNVCLSFITAPGRPEAGRSQPSNAA